MHEKRFLLVSVVGWDLVRRHRAGNNGTDVLACCAGVSRGTGPNGHANGDQYAGCHCGCGIGS